MRVNGLPATAEDLAPLALYGYGSFSSLVVDAGRVQGLDLHLERLQHDADALFGATVDEARVRRWLREASARSAGPVSARITLFQRAFSISRPVDGPPDVLITTRPASIEPPASMRVATTAFVRDTPEVKHTGLFAQLHHRRAAQVRGFDDVLFVDSHDHMSEGATWNIAFATADGRIRWPPGRRTARRDDAPAAGHPAPSRLRRRLGPCPSGRLARIPTRLRDQRRRGDPQHHRDRRPTIGSERRVGEITSRVLDEHFGTGAVSALGSAVAAR